MALEITATNVLIGIGIAILANIIYGVSGWIKSGDPFNSRKFAGTIITAVAVGIVAGIAVVPQIASAATQTDLLIIYGTLFTAPIVVDVFRTNVSGAISNRAVEEVIDETEPVI